MMVATIPFSTTPNIVMVVLGTTIHEFACHHTDLAHRNSWMVGPSPTTTERAEGRARAHHRALGYRKRYATSVSMLMMMKIAPTTMVPPSTAGMSWPKIESVM